MIRRSLMRFLLISGLILVFSSTCHATVTVVINEVARDGDQRTVVITFIDESGHGLARYRVRDSAGATLVEGELECERSFTTPPLAVPVYHFPLRAGSTECGESGIDSAPAGYTNETPLAATALPAIPVEPEDNPCNEPPLTREEGGTPCANGRDFVLGIGEEIEDLCAEWARYHEDFNHHDTLMDEFVAATAVLLVVALACFLIAFKLPWPADLILKIIAAALFVAALVTGSLANYHMREAERAREQREDAESRLEDARSRYRAAVAAAIEACCGAIPSGMPLDPPECESAP